MGPILIVLGLGVFIVGTVVGSFLNVCIYRIPWEKSVIWPGSRCPACCQPIAAQDNVPILSWLALRGECRSCGAPISARYPLVELLVGLLFLGVYYVDVIHGPRGPWGHEIVLPLATLAYHAILVALLVAATFIDYDLFIIPDEITVTGMVLGLVLPTVVPAIRAEPACATTHGQGFWMGLLGLLVGAGLTQLVRLVGSTVLRREAMGFGDVTLMGMIGVFLGWQAAIMAFFLGACFGLIHAVWKLTIYVKKWLRRQKLSSADRELPFGPYLSMGALALVLSWHWLWISPGPAREAFSTFRWFFWWMLGVDVGPNCPRCW
jgi:leader peptidase (prepilin peptidase)/N-methyltransferase